MTCLLDLIVVLISLCTLSAAFESSSGSQIIDTPAPTPVPVDTTPSPSSSSSLTPIPTAAVDSATFALVDSSICSDAVADKITMMYGMNKDLFEACVEDSQYQIFPYSGQHATAEQVATMSTSANCLAIFAAIVLAKIPECNISDLPMKAAVETLLTVAVNMEDGTPSPDADRFQALMSWRRDSNTAKAVGLPYDSDSQLYLEFTTALDRAMAESTVVLSSDLAITFEDNKLVASASTAEDGDDLGTVAPDGSATGSNGLEIYVTPEPTSASTSVNPSTMISLVPTLVVVILTLSP